jgi:formylglycine-generating enzyme required for sulfatase activity
MCLAALTAACAHDEVSGPAPAGTDTWLTFVAVPDAATTRVTADSHWQVDDRIGIYMVEAGKKLAPETIVNEAANRQYKVESLQGDRAVFVPATGDDTIFIPARKKVSFIAYYPYTPAIDKDFNFPITKLKKQNLASPPDLLFSNTTDVYGSGTFPKNIPLLFHHQMAKVKFDIIRTLTTPAPLSSLVVEIKNVRISPLNFSLTDGTMAYDGAASNTSLTAAVDIKSSDSATAEALLVPAKNSSQVLALIRLDNKGHEYNIPLKGRDSSLRAATTYRYEVILDDPIPIDWVYITAGTFMMGSPSNEPDRRKDETQHQVTLTKHFKMSRYEISCEQYASFLNKAKIESDGKSNVEGFGVQSLIDASPSNPKLKWKNNRWEVVAGKEKHPITFVSWFGAKAFADWMGCSLPTEAQQEYALRAGTQTVYFFGNDVKDADKYVWHSGNSGGDTHPVGQKLPNAWNLYDMIGNVHEYCADWYQENLGSQPVTNPLINTPGSQNWRCHRGGSFTDDPRYYHRSAARSGRQPYNTHHANVGIRLVYVFP